MDWYLWYIQFAPQSWLISLCDRVKEEHGTLGENKYGNPVIKLSETIAVKYGYGVSASEAATQKYAYQHVDPKIVRVPRVHRYFEDHSDPRTVIGYLFMDYIAGQNMQEIDLDADNDITKRLANIIAHLGGIKGGVVPGPVGGGMPDGYLFGDLGTRTVFNCVEDLNFWLNKRLTLIGKSIDLTPFPLVLCHMDLCRRNLVLMEDQSIGLLDWGHAGFFPRVFDVTAIKCYNDKYIYFKALYEAVKEVVVLEEDEILCIDLLMRARAGSLRYRFETD